MTSTVQTVAGVVPADRLGTTLIHEHLIVTHAELEHNLPHPEWNHASVADRVRIQLKELAALGVQTLVDLTVPGLGRDVRRIAEIVEDAPVNVVVSTGYYTMDVLPPFFQLNGPGRLVEGPDPLAEMFHNDITSGIGSTSIRAGMIKVASGAHGLTEDVTRVFTAAALAHRETGVPITTHSDPSQHNGLDQQRILRDLKVPLDRVVIGHSGDSTDIDYLCALADEGSFLGFDRFGMTHQGSDEQRVRTLLKLLERGYHKQLVLSQDAAVFSQLTPPSWRQEHAPLWRMDHLHRTILPQLRTAGVDNDLEHQLMVDNPRRVLAGQ